MGTQGGGSPFRCPPASQHPPAHRAASGSPPLQEPGQKIIDSETAAQMLQLVLPQGRFVDSFCTFLTQQKDYKKVNADQWAK